MKCCAEVWRALPGTILCAFLFTLLLPANVLTAQEFRIRPTNKSVILGQTTILPCEVDNVVGKVQWTLNGFALGFNRDIPGYRRYKMLGEESAGEFGLMISDVRLTDDAEFQCQVGPADGQPPILASAYLTVQVPCEAPQIQRYPNGSEVQVPHTQSLVLLTCVAKNGRPAATITWLKDNEPITKSGDINTKVESAGNKKENAISVLTIRPEFHPDMSDIYYTCQAKNDALAEPLSTTVKMVIQYPPGPPEISGYTNGQAIRAGDTLKLVCVSKGGNPLAQVIWFKNDQEVDFSYTGGNNKAVNELAFTVQATDNDAVYKCEASNVIPSPRPLTASYKLIVHFAPTKVEISGQKLAKAGEEVTLSCVTTNSNPAAVVTWFAKGKQLQLPKSATRVEPSPDGGYITHSDVTVQLTDQENNVIYSCQATNSVLGLTVTDAVTLSVLYPPNPPIIPDYTSASAAIAGELKRMSCTSVGGNPPATLKWFKGDTPLDSEVKKVGTIVTADVAVVLKPDDNGAVYKCQASNEATTEPLETSITLKVYYPPETVNITAAPSDPRVGQKMNLTCVSSPSNPAAVITWIKDGYQIDGNDGGQTDTKWGGKITTNRLEIVPTSDDHEQVYGCRATNQVLDQSVNDAVTLDILFKPEFDMEVSPAIILIVEGESKVVNYTVKANPTEVTYYLQRDGIRLSLEDDLPRFSINAGLLSIEEVEKGDSGLYTLEAENAEGSTLLNITVDVQFPATISSISTPVFKQEGEVAFFECVAEANPLPPDSVTWTRENYEPFASKTKQEYKNGRSVLTVYDLERTDTGAFTCTAFNGIGESVTELAHLIVKFSPVIDKSREYGKSASDKGATGRLLCKAQGAPNITFTWMKGEEVINTAGPKYGVESKPQEMYSIDYENVLLVNDVVKKDYGTYTCKATNDEGEDSFDIILDGTSKPDPPYNIRFVNATHNSVTIAWTRGFDGGLPQTFRVRYKPTGDEGYTYVDVKPNNITVYTVTGLKLGTHYELTLLAFNDLGESEYNIDGIVAKTSSVAPPEETTTSSFSGQDEVPLIIILVVCIVGVFLLALNVALILYFIRRRRKRLENGSDSTSQTNTIELYGPSKETALYPMSPSEVDSRSYTSYDKTIDDFSDDLNKSYDDDDVKRVFLPPHDYSGRPYTPSRHDSPRLSHQRKYPSSQTTYLDDSDRKSPWRSEDRNTYRSATPVRKGNSTFDGPPRGEIPYNDQIRHKSRSGIVYDPAGNVIGREDTRPKVGPWVLNANSLNVDADRPASRNSSKNPPPPPIRSSSRGAADIPPVPARNYSPQEMPPRYGPPPGSLVNSMSNPTYEGPNPQRSTSPRGKVDVRGHLV
ncbi:nephrin-like isoform X2 [Liolophura sinensis]|uniref:nephrin-like isoform X2 n=1 Tax=Liolophura sinensis TaxID=3198878 RepID=UPI003158E77B